VRWRCSLAASVAVDSSNADVFVSGYCCALRKTFNTYHSFFGCVSVAELLDVLVKEGRIAFRRPHRPWPFRAADFSKKPTESPVRCTALGPMVARRGPASTDLLVVLAMR